VEWITITPQEMKRIETAAMEAGACTGEALMGRAAEAVAQAAERLAGSEPGLVAAVCGTGNNGGDAMAALRILLSRRADLTGVCLVLEGTLTPDARRELERLRTRCPGVQILPVGESWLSQEWFAAGQLIDPETVKASGGLRCIIDGLFGTGLCRPVGGIPAALCRNMNRAEGCPIVAVDIPSGLCGRTGQVLGTCVHAHETVTFHRPKPGLLLGKGPEYTGSITVAPIGLPPVWDDAEGLSVWSWEQVEAHLPRYRATDHKGDHGRVVLFCGSLGMAGAAALAATAALRTGAGLVTVACPERIVDTVQQLCPCATCLPLPTDAGEAFALLEPLLSAADALGMGCGLGQGEWAKAMTGKVLDYLSRHSLPAVMDADALNLLAQQDAPAYDLSRCVLTPHPGEAARLLGCSAREIGADAVAAALQLRQRWGAAGVVLKGAASVIATPSGMAINRIGTPALAKGGSGDVLTGVLAALLGLNARMAAAADAEDDPRRPLTLRELLQVGCGLHGHAGQAAEQVVGTRGVLASDTIKYLCTPARPARPLA